SVYLDADQNPYDGASLLTGKSITSASVINGRIGVPTAGLRAGSYYLATLVTDSAGHARWSYTASKITITNPTFATLSDGLLTVNGTAAADTIVLAPSGASLLAR